MAALSPSADVINPGSQGADATPPAERVILSDHDKQILGAILSTWPGATINPVPVSWAPPPNTPGNRQPSWADAADAPVAGTAAGAAARRAGGPSARKQRAGVAAPAIRPTICRLRP